MQKKLSRIVFVAVLALCALVLSMPATPARAQEEPTAIDQLIAQMSPEERVGQLFLVTFPGTDVSDASMAATLVRELRVGGVALRASNGNYQNDEDNVSELVTLTNGLQALARTDGPEGGEEEPFIPLFIATDLYSPTPLYADGLPQGAFTRIPSEMAMGATWKPENAEAVGRIVGQELAAVGVNLLLGPALDVVDAPRPQQTNPGTRTFGGDPYWVGKMGLAFVRGVTTGSGRSVGTVARHFPGLGSSDRSANEEIAAVQKTLQELQQIDLPPFFAVTSPNVITGTVDGLMTTNLRYRGLQGNIRQTTRPLALDPQTLPVVINQPELQPWRQAGGILLSDELGAMALRRFYAQQSENGSFPAVQIADDAFNAGNDLLFLSDFAAEEDWDSRLANIRATIQSFTDKYRNDPVFALDVDESLRRLLALKLRLYGGDFAAAAAPLPDPATFDNSPFALPESRSEIARIAQESATLLYPAPEELADRLPGPPGPGESIVILTDARTTRDCATCPERPVIEVNEFQESLLRRYGPQGSRQLTPDQITSLSFEQLNALAVPTIDPASLELAATVRDADWLIFLMQNVTSEVPNSDALRNFLREFPGLTPGQKLVVFAFGAPYYLDATEVSKVTAYYGFYSPIANFVDAAARLLFQTYSPPGAPPVSTYPLLNYRLDVQLASDPNQVVQFCEDRPEIPDTTCVPPPSIIEGDPAGNEIRLRTSVIRDRNGNPVPDGTDVVFRLRYPAENVNLDDQRAQTVNGVARTVVPLNRPGLLAISVESSDPPSFSSSTLQVQISGVEPPVVATATLPPPTETPTPTPSHTPTATATRTPRPTRTATPPRPTPTPTPTPVSRFGQENDGFGWWTFFGAMVGLLAVGSVGGVTGTQGRDALVRRLLLVAVCGLGGYLLYLIPYAFRLLPEGFNGWGAIFLAVLGGFIALVREP
jgi:beta-N-acetylhexosaminidase